MTATRTTHHKSSGKRRHWPKPEGHTLYWVYAYWPDGDYNFDTSKRLAEALKAFTMFRKDGAKETFIFHGNEDGAFTHLDTVKSFYGTNP